MSEKKITTISTPFGTSSFFEDAWRTIARAEKDSMLDHADMSEGPTLTDEEIRTRAREALAGLGADKDSMTFGPITHLKVGGRKISHPKKPDDD